MAAGDDWISLHQQVSIRCVQYRPDLDAGGLPCLEI